MSERTISTASDELLSVADLRVHFRTDAGVVRAVDGVSLVLRRGETLGLVGESGSGKTVLARRIMGLVHDGPTTRSAGTIVYDGTELTRLSPAKLMRFWGREMAMVFQDPMTSLNPVKRIGVQVTESMRHHLHLSKRDAKARAIDLLDSVGIAEPRRRIRQYPHELSGGMRQRVTIAIALACSPRLLFADEPTTALDVTVQAQILDLLQERQQRLEMAMVLVTHDLGVVKGRTDRIAVMYAGRIVETAPTPEVFINPLMPYTEALMNAVPRLSAHTHSRLRSIPGRPPNLIAPPRGCKFSPRCPYAQERCLVEEPPLRAAPGAGGSDHLYRCWFPVGSVEWTRARDKNLSSGANATGLTVQPEQVAV